MQQNPSDKYNAFRTKQGNIVWAGAMCLAWQTLKKILNAQQLKFQTNNHEALQTIKKFNSSLFSCKDISSLSYYAKAGFGKQTQQLINKQVKQKFPNFSFKDLNYKMGHKDIISYAYLYKKLIFKQMFKRLQFGNMLFNGVSVDSFCAETYEQKNQIHVIQFNNIDLFSVEIHDEATKDCLFIIKNPKIKTVDQAINYAVSVQKSKAYRPSLTKIDLFQMPIVEIYCQRDFKQMIGLRFENTKLEDHTISVMLQALKLKIDQYGAKVENLAVIVAQKSKVLAKQQPRHFILNNSFWIVMKQPKSHPYLCVQINKPIEK